jgi:hypothetical protein
VSASLTVVLATLSSAGAAYLAHLGSLPHYHLLGGIPIGAALIGIGAATGVALAIKLTSSYDTAGFRIFAQLGGIAAYAGAVLLDYLAYGMHVSKTPSPTPNQITALEYTRMLVEQGAAAIAAQLPDAVKFPPTIAMSLGTVRLIVEVLGALVATGWTISYLTGVPFCWRNRRFYELKHLVESANLAAVQEWEAALRQRRPIEARALLARVRAGKLLAHDRSWVRIAVHQCPICLTARLRIERRRRTRFGRIYTEPADEMQFDAVKASALLAS